MSAFVVILIIVCAGGFAIGLAVYLLGSPVQIGRRGFSWFDHREDLRPDERPDEDALDAPIPRRPLRGR